jgi:hypothetical protein
MTKLQASMKDASAATWRERKVMYKVGSPMKGCRFCGDVEEDEETGKRRYLTGLQVFRAYKPWETKWTWKCWSCGAIDLQCWEPDALGLVEQELGKEPLLGNRENVRLRKYQLRREAMAKAPKPEPKDLVKTNRIAQLEGQLAALMAMVKKGN